MDNIYSTASFLLLFYFASLYATNSGTDGGTNEEALSQFTLRAIENNAPNTNRPFPVHLLYT